MTDETGELDELTRSAVARSVEQLESRSEDLIENALMRLPAEARPVFCDILGAASWAKAQLPVGLRCGRVLVGRYELREPIGEGGFGTVWRARDRRIGTEVAVKLVAPAPDGPGPHPDAFDNEIRALSQIRSPHVGRVLDSGREGDSLFLVLELEKGRTLSEVLEELRERAAPGTPPDMSRVRVALRLSCPPGVVDLVDAPSWFCFSARVIVAVLRALEATHGQGILHRDIKPANIVLRACGNPVLLDFGLACLRQDRTRSATTGLFGSIPYMAPEWLHGLRTGEDPRTDTYQVGLVLYEMLTLCPAFEATTDEDTIARVREGTPIHATSHAACHAHWRMSACGPSTPIRSANTRPPRRFGRTWSAGSEAARCPAPRAATG